MILSTSCSNDSNTIEETVASVPLKDGNSTSEVSTSNSRNPYENVGLLYDQLSKNYYEENNLPRTINDIVQRVEMVVHNNRAFNELKGNYYQPITSERVQYIAEHQDIYLKEVINNSSLSNNGKRSLNQFVGSLRPFYELGNDFVGFYNYIEKYENIIINSAVLNANDKRIILVTTAIAKHTNYNITSPEADHSNHMFMKEPEKNKDRDWGVLVGNIIATTEGSDESIAKSISLSLAVGATINN